MKLFDHFPCKEASSFLFAMAAGGDGAPKIGMFVLISFINFGERIAIIAEHSSFWCRCRWEFWYYHSFFEKFDLVTMLEIVLKTWCFDYQIATLALSEKEQSTSERKIGQKRW